MITDLRSDIRDPHNVDQATPTGPLSNSAVNPRVIADEIWAKFLWAGLNLEQGDLPVTNAGHFYPFELVRAITLTWLFGGLRSDEIARLRRGCVRWQHDGTAITGNSQQVLARDAVCLLDVPTNKLGFGRKQPTVRVADGEPGQDVQVDFGRLGLVDDPVTGRRRVVQGLIFTAVYSRHMFVYPTLRQTLDEVVAGSRPRGCSSAVCSRLWFRTT